MIEDRTSICLRSKPFWMRRRWVRQGERDSGARPGATTTEQQRIKELEREVRELRKTNEILKLASAYFAQAELDRQLKR